MMKTKTTKQHGSDAPSIGTQDVATQPRVYREHSYVRRPRPTVFGAWAQVRISPQLARAVARLPRGEKTRVVRAALVCACLAHGLGAEPADPRQLTLPNTRHV